MIMQFRNIADEHPSAEIVDRIGVNVNKSIQTFAKNDH